MKLAYQCQNSCPHNSSDHKIGHTTVNLSPVRKFLHVEQLHKGCFLFEKWLEEIAFFSKDDLKWMVSTAERWKDGEIDGKMDRQIDGKMDR